MAGIVDFNNEEILNFLSSKGFKNYQTVLNCLKECGMNGETFLKLTRDDLKDLFPNANDFSHRKKLWDFVEDIRSAAISGLLCDSQVSKAESINSEQQEEAGNSSYCSDNTMVTDDESSQMITPLKRKRSSVTASSVSTLSSDCELVSSRKSPDGCPPLKRTHAFRADAKDDGEIKYVFPVSRDMRKCEEEGVFPPQNVRTAFIRDCFSCLTAAAGETPTMAQYISASKQICQSMTILKDKRPPWFPKDRPYDNWTSVLCSLRKRSYNTKKSKLVEGSSSSSTSSDDCATALNTDNGKEDEKMNDQISKELSKKKVNNVAVREMLEVTFSNRHNVVTTNDFPAKDVVNKLTSMYPFLKSGLVLALELELHLKGSCDEYQENWNSIIENCTKLVPADKDDISPEKASGQALANLHTHFTASPLLYYIEDNEVEEALQNNISTNSPVLAVHKIDDYDKQIFIIIDKKIFLELSNDLTYGDALILLLATYYAFNLKFDIKQVNMFTFLTEYILKIPSKKRTLKYKRQINILMSN